MNRSLTRSRIGWIGWLLPRISGGYPIKLFQDSAHLLRTGSKIGYYITVLALRDILIGEHLQCWQHFVLACRKLCRSHLHSSDIHLGDALLMQFCTRYERIYGKQAVTPNIYLHAHLRECFLDYRRVGFLSTHHF